MIDMSLRKSMEHSGKNNIDVNSWMKKLARQSLRYGEFVCGGVIFTYAPFLKREKGESVKGGLFLPDRSWEKRSFVMTLGIPEFLRAQQQADLLRKTIVDPRLPSELKLVSDDYNTIFIGGRYNDVVLLGQTKYARALPELMEVANHDPEEKIRYVAIESIGEIGEAGKAYAGQIAKVLRFDKSLWVRGEAAETLGKLNNREVIPRLREEVEEARALAIAYNELGYLFKNDMEKNYLCSYTGTLFEKALISLFKLDNKIGKEEMDRSFGYDDILVNTHTKNAVFWCQAGGITRLPDPMLKDEQFIQVPFTFNPSSDLSPRDMEF